MPGLVVLAVTMGASVVGCAPATVRTPQPAASPAASSLESPAWSPVLPTIAVSPSPATPPTAASYILPIVPVVGFWVTAKSISTAELTRLWLAGGGPGASTLPYATLYVDTAAYRAMIELAAAGPGAAVQVVTTDRVKAAVASSSSVIGLIAADDVTPDVRAVAIDGRSLFGPGRVTDATLWPLRLMTDSRPAFSPAAEWTLAAGGDVNLDRRVYTASIGRGNGVNWPWSGGSAVVKSISCCGFDGAAIPFARQTGNPGVVSAILRGSDLAIVNLEGSAPDDWVYRPNSLIFTFDPELLAGLRNAGIDAVSLANNHIGNDGPAGVIATCRNVAAAGLEHAGAGATPTAARSPAWLSAGDLKVALLAYTAVAGGWVSAARAGAAPLRIDEVTADIRAAKAAGAHLVIVMPHWGTEYSRFVGADQKREAAAMVSAGADLVLGSHSHWAGAIASIARPTGPAFIDYSMGDFLFDLNHDVWSDEGVILEFSFVGTRLAQVRLQPTVMVDGAQIGLLDPAGDGAAELAAIRRASRGLLGW